MTAREKIQRQKEMNEFVLNNENAVEKAFDQHEKAVQDIQNSYDVVKK